MAEKERSLPEINLDKELGHIISSLPTIRGFGNLAIANGVEREEIATKITIVVASLQAISDSIVVDTPSNTNQ